MTFLTRLRVVRKVLIKNCTSLDTEGETSRLLRRCSMTLLRPVLAICFKSQEPSFRGVINSFVLLVQASLAVI